MAEQACSLARRLVVSLLDCRERRAEDRLRLFHRAALHQHNRFVDVSALERLHGYAPRIGLAGPIAELDPPPHDVVIRDRAAFVFAAPNGDGSGLPQPEQPDLGTGAGIRGVGNADVETPSASATVGSNDIAPFFRLAAMASSIAALSLPRAWRLPFTTTCGV